MALLTDLIVEADGRTRERSYHAVSMSWANTRSNSCDGAGSECQVSRRSSPCHRGITCTWKKDVLTGGVACGVLDVHAVRVEGGLQQGGDSVDHVGDLPVRGLGDLPHVRRVHAWNHQRVSRRGGPDIQERHGVLVLKHAVTRRPAGDDLAEIAGGH